MIETAVYDPAHEGDLEKVRAWLEKNPARLNDEISDGYTLLHVACLFGHEPIVSYLLGRGALVNVNAKNRSKATPLHAAVMFREEEVAERIAKLLIVHGAELNAVQAGGQTALHHAVGRGSLRLVEMLIEAGADPHWKDDQGRAPTDVARQLAETGLSESLQQALKKAHALTI